MHTAHETVKWLRDTWNKSVAPRFSEINKQLLLNEPYLKPDQLRANNPLAGTTNPLLRFFRPASAQDIANALASLSSSKREALERDVIRPYIAAWGELLQQLITYTGNNRIVGGLTFPFGLLSRSFVEKLSTRDAFEYKSNFKEFCRQFEKLPLKGVPNKVKKTYVKDSELEERRDLVRRMAKYFANRMLKIKRGEVLYEKRKKKYTYDAALDEYHERNMPEEYFALLVPAPHYRDETIKTYIRQAYVALKTGE